jgi:hypothetical protein
MARDHALESGPKQRTLERDVVQHYAQVEHAVAGEGRIVVIVVLFESDLLAGSGLVVVLE